MILESYLKLNLQRPWKSLRRSKLKDHKKTMPVQSAKSRVDKLFTSKFYVLSAINKAASIV